MGLGYSTYLGEDCPRVKQASSALHMQILLTVDTGGGASLSGPANPSGGIGCTFRLIEILLIVHPVLHPVAVRLRLGGAPAIREPQPLQLLYQVDVGGALVLTKLAGRHRLPQLLCLHQILDEKPCIKVGCWRGGGFPCSMSLMKL